MDWKRLFFSLSLSPVQQPLKLCGITTHHTELSTRQQAAAAASIPECATLQQTVREREKKNSHTQPTHNSPPSVLEEEGEIRRQ